MKLGKYVYVLAGEGYVSLVLVRFLETSPNFTAQRGNYFYNDLLMKHLRPEEHRWGKRQSPAATRASLVLQGMCVE